MKYHKHAKLIKAWANGAKIQWWNVEHRRWVDLDDSRPFSWDESIVYSVKPEEKQEPVAYKYTDKTNPLVFYFTTHKDSLPNPDVIETELYTAPPKREWVCKKCGEQNVD